ncbi:MAG: hypothetical protein ACOC5D_00755 [Thermoplasmatota archaeon]
MKRFTFQYYEKLLETLKQNGYKFIFFEDLDKIQKQEEKIVLLRHDIDFDVHQAKKICEIEKEYDVKSTYFFLLNSKFYNIHNSETYEIINQIIDEGNELGIHFDEKSYEYSSNSDLNNFIRKEMNFFEQLFDKEINIVSFHRPTSNVLLNKIDLPVPHTYEDKYAGEVKYLSDSKRQFREGDLIDIIDSNKYNKLQLLIHPIWWNQEKISSQEIYDEFVKRKVIELKNEISDNSSIYQFEGNDD